MEERESIRTGKQESFVKLVWADWRLIYRQFQWKGRGLKRAGEPDYLNYHYQIINSKGRFRFLP
jgi:hypothetical protein